MASELARLKAEKIKLLDLYTPQYPAVVKLNEKIAQTEASLNSLQVWKDIWSSSAQAQWFLRIDDRCRWRHLPRATTWSITANRLEIENLSKDEKRLKEQIDQYQIRLNTTPVREQQLAGILRNYEQLKQDYSELLAKESQSQMAAELEKRQEGQQFRLVDRPSLPTVPSTPTALRSASVRVGGGIALGLALAFLMNMTDRSFHSEEDLSQCFDLPLVVGVPLLLTSCE